MKKTTEMSNSSKILTIATLSLGLALGVNSNATAHPQENIKPKLEGGKEGLATSKQQKHNIGSQAVCDQHKLGSVSGQIKSDAKSANYIKFDGVEGNCVKPQDSANQIKFDGVSSSQIKDHSASQIKVENKSNNSADFIKR